MGDEYDDVDHAGGLEVGIAATGVRHDCRRFRNTGSRLSPIGECTHELSSVVQSTSNESCVLWGADLYRDVSAGNTQLVSARR